MTVSLKHNNELVSSPQAVYDILSKVLENEEPEDQDKEHFWVFLLTPRNTIKSLHLVALGTIDQAIVHPREVFTRAIADRCSSIVVAHNHPSKDPKPSIEDITTTKTLVKSGEILGIAVIDHVIVAGDQFYSLKQEGCI